MEPRENEAVILSDKAVACLDASNQIKNLRAACNNSVGIKTGFKYAAIITCAGVASSIVCQTLLVSSTGHFGNIGSFIFPFIAVGSYGLYEGIHNYHIDKNNFNNVLLPAVAMLVKVSRVKALKMIKEKNPAYIRAIDSFSASEPTNLLHDPDVIERYNKNLKKLEELRNDPNKKSIKLVHGTRVPRTGFVL